MIRSSTAVPQAAPDGLAELEAARRLVPSHLAAQFGLAKQLLEERRWEEVPLLLEKVGALHAKDRRRLAAAIRQLWEARF